MNQIDLYQLLSKRWKSIALIFAVCLIISALAYLCVPKTYESEMKLLIKNERASLLVTPATGPDAVDGDVSEATVNSEIELLRSRDLLRAVVLDAKLYSNGDRSARAVEKATMRLNNKLKVDPVRKSAIIDVSYTNPDASLAAFVLQDLGEKYLAAHVAAHSAPNTYGFFSTQADKFHTELEESRTTLAAFRNRTGLFSIDQQRSATVAHFEDAKQQMNELNVQIKEYDSRVQTGTNELWETPSRLLTTDKESPNQLALERFQTSLTELTNKRTALLAKFQPTAREVTELDAEIVNTAKALEEARHNVVRETTTDLNKVYTSIATDLAANRVVLGGLKAKRGAMVTVVEGYKKILGTLDQDSITMQDFESKEQLASANYQLYSRRLEEARLADSLDRQQIGNVTIVEKPAVSFLSSPKFGLFLAAGSAIGIFLAFAGAALLELRKSAGGPRLAFAE